MVIIMISVITRFRYFFFCFVSFCFFWLPPVDSESISSGVTGFYRVLLTGFLVVTFTIWLDQIEPCEALWKAFTEFFTGFFSEPAL